jgi:uncharacterized protein
MEIINDMMQWYKQIPMKTDLNYLPADKQTELAKVVAIITSIVPAEMIILFGSYARDGWVEEKYDAEHYRYQSDFDVLVVVETKREFTQSKFERDLEDKIDQTDSIKTPVSIIVHDVNFINRRLSKAQYFFTDIKKEGILLYDSGKYQLSEAKELLPEERKKLAQEDFNYYFEKARNFRKLFKFALSEQDYNEAAFLLHQTTEQLYTAILLVFTRYKPNTHDLLVLRKLTNSIDNRFVKIFSLENSESRRVFKLLRKAYIDARYKPSYTITEDELLRLDKQVKDLKKIGKLLCSKKINNFTEDSEE